MPAKRTTGSSSQTKPLARWSNKPLQYVQIIKLGGNRKIIPTPSFLELNPENLSKNFRISSIFGIDYQHQAVSVTEVPTIFEKALTKGLSEMVPAESLRNLTVQFGSAGASSLDYEIAADFSGKLAPKYQILRRAIQRICVEVCNEHDWGIPFTQITIHQADSE